MWPTQTEYECDQLRCEVAKLRQTFGAQQALNYKYQNMFFKAVEECRIERCRRCVDRMAKSARRRRKRRHFIILAGYAGCAVFTAALFLLSLFGKKEGIDLLKMI